MTDSPIGTSPSDSDFVWTEAREVEVMDRWSRGQSAREIAEAIGCGLNRNKVIGKVHRLQAKQTKADIAERAALRAERVKALAWPPAIEFPPPGVAPKGSRNLGVVTTLPGTVGKEDPAPITACVSKSGLRTPPAKGSSTSDAGPGGKKAPATVPNRTTEGVIVQPLPVAPTPDAGPGRDDAPATINFPVHPESAFPRQDRIVAGLMDGPLTTTALARRLGLAAVNIHRGLQALQAKGFVSRTGEVETVRKGQKAYLWSLTVAGRAYTPTLLPKKVEKVEAPKPVIFWPPGVNRQVAVLSAMRQGFVTSSEIAAGFDLLSRDINRSLEQLQVKGLVRRTEETVIVAHGQKGFIWALTPAGRTCDLSRLSSPMGRPVGASLPKPATVAAGESPKPSLAVVARSEPAVPVEPPPLLEPEPVDFFAHLRFAPPSDRSAELRCRAPNCSGASVGRSLWCSFHHDRMVSKPHSRSKQEPRPREKLARYQ